MKKPKLTRRRLLATVGAAGAAIGGAGLLTEPSLTYADSTTVQVGSTTLNVDWRETYNGEVKEDTRVSTESDPVINLGDILPGDVGTLSFRLTNPSGSDSVDPELTLGLDQAHENGLEEPEKKAGDTSTDAPENDFAGELQNHVDATLWKDTGLLGIDWFGADNATQEFGEEPIINGTLKEVADGVEGEPLGTLAGGESTSVAFRWEYTESADVNESQGDSATFGFKLDPADSTGGT